MASIKISALGELELDRLSDSDVFIINDQDTTTQKITFETLKKGLDRDERYFTGPVEFSNTVTFQGPVAGRNVYTKDETLFEINAAVDPVKADVAAAETDIENLRMLAGIDRVSGIIPSVYIGGTFESAVIPQFSAGPLSIVGAVNAIGAHLEVVAGNIADNASDITANGVLIQVNTDKNAEQDLKIEELQNAVGLPGNNISGNASNISDNTDNISDLASTIGVAVGDVNLGAMNATYLSDNSTVKNNLKELNAQAVAEEARVTTVIADLANTDAAVVTDAARLQTLIDTIDSVGTTLDPAATAKEFAEALNVAIAAALTP